MAGQTRQLAELLRGAGATVELVQTNAAYRPAWVRRLPLLRAAFRLVPYLWKLWLAAGRNDLFHVMANSGWSWHLFAAPAILVAAFRRVPVVVNYRGGEAASFLSRSHRQVRATLSCAQAIAVPSGFLQDIFARYGIPTTIVPNVVDVKRFRPGAGSSGVGPHIVVTRNLEAIYDNATAIRAFAIVRRSRPFARLTIAGTGPEAVALQRLAEELGVARFVAFPGRLEPESVASLYQEADVALNPSTVDNMPISILEALASGVPVVSTNVGGVPYVVKDGTTALLVPPRDASAMAEAILKLFESPEQTAEMIASALASVHRFTWEEVSPSLRSVYGMAMGTHDQ